jgi:hypothetical protein
MRAYPCPGEGVIMIAMMIRDGEGGSMEWGFISWFCAGVKGGGGAGGFKCKLMYRFKWAAVRRRGPRCRGDRRGG